MADDFQKAVDHADYRLANPKRAKRWRQSTCPLCGRTISESAGSGLSGNLKRHVAACEKRRTS